MAIFVRASELSEIAPMREKYRREMNCQIIHDSIHVRAGWSREIAIELEDGLVIGYGSVAVAGPWTNRSALYEFFIEREHRMLMFEAFTLLLETCGAGTMETQSGSLLWMAGLLGRAACFITTTGRMAMFIWRSPSRFASGDLGRIWCRN